MKLSVRILIINFVIVVIILGSAAFAFYSIMYNVLTSQQSKHLQSSLNDFLYTYRDQLQNTEDDFFKAENSGADLFNSPRSLSKNLDFIFELKPNESNVSRWISSNEVVFPKGKFSPDDFLRENPFVALKLFKDKNDNFFYYGKMLSAGMLDNISTKINAEVSLVYDGTPLEFSNSENNNKYFLQLKNAFDDLSKKGSSSVYASDHESTDLVAALFTPSGLTENKNINFLVFSTINEAADLRANIRSLIIIIGVVGSILSIILTLVFTDKIRKQITQLNKATEATKAGDFTTHIEVKSKDEIGQLAGAFNLMMDELNKNQKVKNEYSEFITLLNQNPTLDEISNAALKKIIGTCNFTIGALYTVEEKTVKMISSYGIKKDFLNSSPDLFTPVLSDHKPIEIDSTENLPVVETGLLSFYIKHLLIQPIIYNNKVIAVLELGGIEKTSDEAKEYLLNIQEQLAIGLTNALALVQMEKLITESEIT